MGHCALFGTFLHGTIAVIEDLGYGASLKEEWSGDVVVEWLRQAEDRGMGPARCLVMSSEFSWRLSGAGGGR